jgi:opacity protein-like surface antigen
MRKLILLCTLLLAAGAAEAEPALGVYAGAGITTGSIDNFLGSGLDIHNTDFKLFAGVHPAASPFGVEVQYVDFGSETRTFAHAQADAAAISAVGYLPLPVPMFSVYGKAGLSRWELNGNLGAPGTPAFLGLDDNGVQFTWGVGALAHFGNLAARLEYEHFVVSNTDGANIVTIGVQVTVL